MRPSLRCLAWLRETRSDASIREPVHSRYVRCRMPASSGCRLGSSSSHSQKSRWRWRGLSYGFLRRATASHSAQFTRGEILMRNDQPHLPVGPRWRQHLLRALMYRTAASNGLTSNSGSRAGRSCDVRHRLAHRVADSVATQSRHRSLRTPTTRGRRSARSSCTPIGWSF